LGAIGALGSPERRPEEHGGEDDQDQVGAYTELQQGNLLPVIQWRGQLVKLTTDVSNIQAA